MGHSSATSLNIKENQIKASVLKITDLNLNMYIGVSEEERRTKQPILVSIEIALLPPPTGITSDDINDTICYDKLIQKINQTLGNRPFKLIERLAYEIFSIVKSMATENDTRVSVQKAPKIGDFPDFNGFITFEIRG